MQHIGLVSRAYRKHPHHVALYGKDRIPQEIVGDWLGLSQPQISRIENGPPVRHLDDLTHWAKTLRIPEHLLWFTLPDGQPSDERAHITETSPAPVASVSMRPPAAAPVPFAPLSNGKPTGVELPVGDLLCVDWVSPHGPWDDLLAFIFDGGELSDEQIAGLTLIDGELAAFEFCTEEQAQQRLRPYVWRRAATALEALETRHVQYLQDGYPR